MGSSSFGHVSVDINGTSQLDALDAQRSLFGVQQALVQTRLAYLQNQVVMYKTLGGGNL